MLSEQQADKLEFPAVTIELGSVDEKMDMRHLADLSTEAVTLYPNTINKPIAYLVRPTAGSYDPTTGTFTFASAVDLSTIVPGQVLVDPSTGNGYVIKSVKSATEIGLLLNLTLSAPTYAIIPQFQAYQARVGHAFMQENYSVTCHGMDQQTTLWLHSIVMYLLLRYRQSLLEAQGGAESIIRSTKMYANEDYSDAGQIIWSRSINLSLQTESQWIMQPHRYIESISLGNDDGFTGGVKIISNLTDTEDLSTVNWSTLRDIAEQGE
jgi:hypothetical protein